MAIERYCNQDLILFSTLSVKEDILSYMAACLLRHGYTKESYREAVLARERVYPTGLGGETIGIAIPHTDIVHVIKPAICLCILKDPVEFGLMGGDDAETVRVSVVFMLALREPEKQLEVLQMVITMLEQEHYLKSLLQCCSAEEALAVLVQAASR